MTESATKSFARQSGLPDHVRKQFLTYVLIDVVIADINKTNPAADHAAITTMAAAFMTVKCESVLFNELNEEAKRAIQPWHATGNPIDA